MLRRVKGRCLWCHLYPAFSISGVSALKHHSADVQRPDGQGANKQTSQQPRFSLLDGAYHANSESSGLDDVGEGEDMLLSDSSSSALAKRADQALQLIGTLLGGNDHECGFVHHERLGRVHCYHGKLH